MRYQDLTQPQLLHVLRTTAVAYLSLAAEDQPYTVPMSFSLDAEGETPLIRMSTSSYSLKAAILRRNPRVCLAFSLMDCAWVDSVLLLGTAVLCGEDPDLHITVPGELLTGRRYYLD